jgi:hypothetical protein
MKRRLLLLFLMKDSMTSKWSFYGIKITSQTMTKLFLVGRAGKVRYAKRGDVEDKMTLVHYDVDVETKAKKQQCLKRLQELSEKSLGEILQLQDPTEEQKRWALRKLKRPSKYWEAFT